MISETWNDYDWSEKLIRKKTSTFRPELPEDAYVFMMKKNPAFEELVKVFDLQMEK